MLLYLLKNPQWHEKEVSSFDLNTIVIEYLCYVLRN